MSDDNTCSKSMPSSRHANSTVSMPLQSVPIRIIFFDCGDVSVADVVFGSGAGVHAGPAGCGAADGSGCNAFGAAVAIGSSGSVSAVDTGVISGAVIASVCAGVSAAVSVGRILSCLLYGAKGPVGGSDRRGRLSVEL